MFDALYPDAADAALTTRGNEVQAKPPTPWFQGFWGAMGSAPVRAGLETGRALKTVAPLQVGNPLAMSPTEQEGMLEDEGINRRNMDRGLRIAIEGMTPDPESTGAASMLLHDVTRFVSKAVAYGAAGGPVGAVVGTGLDEGYNEAARRLDEGVDAATAAKLGVTKGIASGIAVALPVAGKTLAQTLGLAAAGGPVSFVAEQATARKILADANHDELASEIDPFDPMGLGVAFFGSLLFGGAAHGMRGMRAKADAAAADARMLAADTPPGKPTEVAQAARAYTPEQVDAAHVSILQAHREGSALHRADDIASSAGHARALDRATEQMAAGERVSVADVAPVDAARIVDEVLPRLQRAEAALVKAEGVALRDLPEPVQQDIGTAIFTRDAYTPVAQFMDAWEAAGRALDDFTEGKIIEVLQAHPELRMRVEEANPVEINDAGRAVSEGVVAEYRAKRAESEPPPILVRRDEDGALHVVEGGHRLQAAKREGADRIPVVDVTDLMARSAADLFASRPAAAPAKGSTDTPAKPAEASTPEGAAAESPAVDYLAREADAIAQADPGMLVMMEGMDSPRPMSEVLAEARALMEQEIADAPLLQVAAECALRG